VSPRASIVIVTYGQRELTELCLRSLQTCLGDRLGPEFELVLVDNASPDDTPELLRSWSDRAVVRLLEENRNFAGGCNAGAAAAAGEALIFLNNDTEVTPGALEALAEQALEPGVGAAGCRLHFPDGTLQHAGVAFVHSPALGGAAMPQHVFHHQDVALPAAHGIYEVDCVTAACIAVRTSTFRALEGFDEGYRNGLEDVDLCLRIRVAGEAIVYRGDIEIVHHEGASRGRGADLWATPEKLMVMRHNDQRFVGAWAHLLGQDDELAAALWDASLANEPTARMAATADLVILGQPGGIGPAADEARALLGATAELGWTPAAVDRPAPIVVPRLAEPAASLLRQAQWRAPQPGAPSVIVPAGRHDVHELDGSTVVRVASDTVAVPLERARAVWAASPALADELVAGGLNARDVAVVAPPVLRAPTGGGGGGVLAVLPAHDRVAAQRLLAALRALPADVPVRLSPTATTRHLHREVAEQLPGAELLGPCSDEGRFRDLAATADVVVAVDVGDRWERRALVAAGVGAAAITARRDGPAAAVLGADIAAGEDELAERLQTAVREPGDRAERAQIVAVTCAPEAMRERLDGLPSVRRVA